MFMNDRRMSAELDRYITGNWGEDSFVSDVCEKCGSDFVDGDEPEPRVPLCKECMEKWEREAEEMYGKFEEDFQDEIEEGSRQ